MKLRDFLSVVCLLSAAGACHAVTTLTLGHIVAPDHPRAKACQFFGKTVDTLSKGRLRIEVHGDASLGDAATMLKAVQNGSLDITANTQGPVAAIVPEFNAFGMPFLFADSASAWRVLDGPVGQLLAKKSEAKGLVVLGLWENGLRHFSNSVRPLLKPADFSGLKIRTPPDPVTRDIVEALGGKAHQINYTNLYDALRVGIVDGQENPLVNMQLSHLDEVQKYVSLTAHKYEITPLLIGKRAWDALPEADREVLLEAAKEATRFQRELIRKAERDAHRELMARGVRIDKVDTRPFVTATARIYDKWYASPIGDFVRAVVQASREKP